jgi:hypothetical protein|tara:strand:- start:319 stop:630 length:312 start_codon:yes stop_codon:yes gene_type:complete
MLEIILTISVLINVFFIWYLVKLLKKFLNISDELEGLFILLEEYSNHVDLVYQLERFYGDTTLENLLRHSKSISERAKSFRAIYDINYEPGDEEDYDEDNIEE